MDTPKSEPESPEPETIRADFKPVSQLLQRVLVYSKQFQTWNHDDWPHLKNKEDFQRIYSLTPGQRLPLERVYSEGRDTAADLSHLLCEFGSAGKYPTFKSFVDTVDEYLSKWPARLASTVDNAAFIATDLPFQLYSIDQMIPLARRELEMAVALRDWVRLARRSSLYREEAGISALALRDRIAAVWEHHGSELIIGVVVTVIGGLILAALSASGSALGC